MEEVIKRINELYRKSKIEGLTDDEKKEQEQLRRKYIDAFRNNLKDQLDSIKWVEDEEKNK